MAKKTKKGYTGYLYLLIGISVVIALLIYNQNNKNTNFNSTGNYISGAQNNKAGPSKDRGKASLPSVLRWINPFN